MPHTSVWRERVKVHSLVFLKMSHEFQVHHLLNELVSLLRVRGADVDIDSYADVLLKNRTPYVTTQVDKKLMIILFHVPPPQCPHPIIIFAKIFYHTVETLGKLSNTTEIENSESLLSHCR